MTAAQFYALTYCELALILKGCGERRKREMRERREETAWALTWLLLPHQSKDADPLTVDHILGRKGRKPVRRRFASMEESAQAYFAALAAKSDQRLLTDGQ
jgi:hypothetical protein